MMIHVYNVSVQVLPASVSSKGGNVRSNRKCAPR
jgi:hypothetical protein